MPRLNRAATYPIKTITAKTTEVIAHRGKDLQQRTQRWSQAELIRNRSEQVYQEAVAAVKDFKSQYQKPEECYNLKDDKTRLFYANHFMKARKAYESRKSSGRFRLIDRADSLFLKCLISRIGQCRRLFPQPRLQSSERYR